MTSQCSYQCEIRARAPESLVFGPWKCTEVAATEAGLCIFHDQDEGKDPVAIQRRLLERINEVSEEPLRLDGAFFPSGVSFAQTPFLQSVSFFKTRFCGRATSFENATFRGEEALFDGAEFKSDYTTFAGAEFLCRRTGFKGVQFHSTNTDFSFVTFRGHRVSFIDSWFKGDSVSFAGTVFHGGHTVFSFAKFDTVVTSFNSAHFEAELTYFFGTNFYGEETNLLCEFLSPFVNFSQARLRASSTRIRQPAGGGRLLFKGENPDDVFLGGEVTFMALPVSEVGVIRFEVVNLSRVSLLEADVSRMEFVDVTWSIGEVTGSKKRHRRPRWLLRLYDEVAWKQASRNQRRSGLLSPDELGRLARGYRAIKAYYRGTGEYHLMGHFHYGLMEARRDLQEALALESGCWWLSAKIRKWSSLESLYRFLSGYGEDYVRSVVVLLGMLVAFAIAYVLLGEPAAVGEEALSRRIAHGLLYSVETGALGRVSSYAGPQGLVARWLRLVESVAVPVQFGFFLFAMRNRFRR